MNRHDRRAAAHRGCLAACTAAGGPGIHAPGDCDGTCWTRIAELPAWLVVLLCALLGAEASRPGSAGDAALRMLVLIVRREDSARLRAAALAPLRRLAEELARLRAALKVRGLVGRRRGDGPAGPSCAALLAAITSWPHTGRSPVLPGAGLASRCLARGP